MKKNLILFLLISNFIQAKVIQKPQQKTVAKATQKVTPKKNTVSNIGVNSPTHFPTKKPQQISYPSQSIQSSLSANVAKNAAAQNKDKNIPVKANKIIPVPVVVPIVVGNIDQTITPVVNANQPQDNAYANVQPSPDCTSLNLNYTPEIQTTAKTITADSNCPLQCAIEFQNSCYNSLYNKAQDNGISCGCGLLENVTSN